MCGSKSYGKAWLKQWFLTLPNGQRVLDVGCGKGDYLKWVRRARKIHGFKDRWEAIEVWEPYIAQFRLHRKYARIYRCNFLEFQWSRHAYDVVIFGDCLEHVYRPDAERVIARARTRTRYVAISIPLGNTEPQRADPEDNPYQNHLHEWTYREFMERFPDAMRLDPATKKWKGMFLLEGTAS